MLFWHCPVCSCHCYCCCCLFMLHFVYKFVSVYKSFFFCFFIVCVVGLFFGCCFRFWCCSLDSSECVTSYNQNRVSKLKRRKYTHTHTHAESHVNVVAFRFTTVTFHFIKCHQYSIYEYHIFLEIYVKLSSTLILSTNYSWVQKKTSTPLINSSRIYAPKIWDV